MSEKNQHQKNTMRFAGAIEASLAQAMAENDKVIIMGEDVHTLRANLYSRFGKKRVIPTPISEGAFVGAAVSASMAGLKPIVEVMLVDFIAVAIDPILNHASKNKFFSGGKWNVPVVIRASCGGGYGDAGQHEQSLWGWLAHIPHISVVVPSNPADAGGLMMSAIKAEDPVIYLEHKLLSDYWRDYLGSGGRETVSYDVPKTGAEGPVPETWKPIPFGKLAKKRDGDQITLVSLGVGVHRCLEAAETLKNDGVSAEVLDLRTVAPLDVEGIATSVSKTAKLVVVDEDYKFCGLSGEIAAALLEREIKFEYRRVCTEHTIPYARELEYKTLPNTKRILEISRELV